MPGAPPELLEQLGWTVEHHAVPAALVEANGMIRATNLVVRQAVR